MKKIIYFILFMVLSFSIYAQEMDLDKLYNQAQIATEMGYLEDAIEKYRQILRLSPQFAKGYLELGNVYIKKGQDVPSLENAILNFKKYLNIAPNAENREEVKASLDKLEYVLEKAYQKENARAFLQGRWASTDGQNDKYKRSLFILDIKEFDNKIRIDIEPSSLVYSEDFIAKTVYIDDPNADEYVIMFTNDNTYTPSQAGYNLNRQTINNFSNQIGGGIGYGIAGLGNYLIDKKQEKDVQKKTLTVYEFKIKAIPDEKQELKCVGRLYIREITPTKEQTVLDSVFISSFHKVRSEYTNPIAFVNTSDGIQTASSAFSSALGSLTDNSSSSKSANISKVADKMLSTHPDKRISGLYSSGKNLKTIGNATAITGGCLMGIGILIMGASTGEDMEYDQREKLREVSLWPMVGGLGLTLVSWPIYSVGKSKIKKAVSLYNESLDKERANLSEIKVGFTGNGIGLAFTF
ncbi:MAG: tetratricopeptide repeat protein [Dysgonamonadaceae bacterium]|nr:tetratricopeptide repeat protein [Dysgonamonadaceae bacterium]